MEDVTLISLHYNSDGFGISSNWFDFWISPQVFWLSTATIAGVIVWRKFFRSN